MRLSILSLVGLLLLCAGVDARWGTGGKKVQDAKNRAKIEREVSIVLGTCTRHSIQLQLHGRPRVTRAWRPEQRR